MDRGLQSGRVGIMIRRMVFRAANGVLDVAEGAVRRARAWIDLNYPPQDIDELIAEINDAQRRYSAYDRRDNVVHLPRGARR